jgi:hypothetical protein
VGAVGDDDARRAIAPVFGEVFQDKFGGFASADD